MNTGDNFLFKVFIYYVYNIDIIMEEKQLKMAGLAIIIMGLILLLFTFYQSYSYLNSPYPQASPLKSSPPSTSGQPDINAALSQALTPFFDAMIPLAYSSGYLFLMGLIGFWILGRGIQMVK